MENTNNNHHEGKSLSSAGRPKLAVGAIGKIAFTDMSGKLRGRASTRDAAGRLRRLEAFGASADEIERKLLRRATQLALKAGELTSASSLSELLEVWYDEIVLTREIRPQTVQMYRTKINRLTKWYEALALQELRAHRMQSLVNDLGRKVGRKEFRTLMSILRQVFRYAVRAELVAYSPMGALEQVRYESKKPVALSIEQVQVFRREFNAYVLEGERRSNRRQSQLVVDIILGVGGLRISEALAIRVGDVDFDRNTVNVNGTLVYLAGQPLERQPKLKTKGQERVVRLLPDGMGMRALRAAYESLAPEQRDANMPLVRRISTVGVETPWINPSIIGTHFDAVTKRPAVVEALAKTGLIVKQLTPHTLRRSVATVVSRASGDDAASALLGHSDSRTTRQSYIAPTVKVVDAAGLDDLFSFEENPRT
ncbi:tyrosine-type recombinase/integrase [Schumannella soli]|nr:tyrosine-type recombinase/integrase [Schumannella soli]